EKSPLIPLWQRGKTLLVARRFQLILNFTPPIITGYFLTSRKRSNLISENRYRAAAKILSVGKDSQSGNESNLGAGDLSVAAFAAQLARGFYDVQHSAGRGRLAAIDHAAAGLNRQLSFNRKVGAFKITDVALGAKAEIFDLQINDDDVIVVEFQKIDIAVAYAGHFHGHFPRIGDSHD